MESMGGSGACVAGLAIQGKMHTPIWLLEVLARSIGVKQGCGLYIDEAE